MPYPYRVTVSQECNATRRAINPVVGREKAFCDRTPVDFISARAYQSIAGATRSQCPSLAFVLECSPRQPGKSWLEVHVKSCTPPPLIVTSPLLLRVPRGGIWNGSTCTSVREPTYRSSHGATGG
eukprot:scaffold29203_cov67-Phaeocystis_antarctica.AAC.4